MQLSLFEKGIDEMDRNRIKGKTLLSKSRTNKRYRVTNLSAQDARLIKERFDSQLETLSLDILIMKPEGFVFYRRDSVALSRKIKYLSGVGPGTPISFESHYTIE